MLVVEVRCVNASSWWKRQVESVMTVSTGNPMPTPPLRDALRDRGLPLVELLNCLTYLVMIFYSDLQSLI